MLRTKVMKHQLRISSYYAFNERGNIRVSHGYNSEQVKDRTSSGSIENRVGYLSAMGGLLCISLEDQLQGSRSDLTRAGVCGNRLPYTTNIAAITLPKMSTANPIFGPQLPRVHQGGVPLPPSPGPQPQWLLSPN